MDRLRPLDDRDRLCPSAGGCASGGTLGGVLDGAQAQADTAWMGLQLQARRGKIMPERVAGEVVLSIEHVTVNFGGLVAISDLNFTVCDGEIVGLIGPNGAGKTTAFNVVTGFMKPTAGA